MTEAKPLLAPLAADGAIAAAAVGTTAYARTRGSLTQEARFDHRATGVAVMQDGRRFVDPQRFSFAPVAK